MKKFLILVFSLLLFIGVKAQDKVIYPPISTQVWGATSDTLVASDTIAYSLRVNCKNVQDISLTLQLTKVSGTVTNVFTIYGANILEETAYDSVGSVTYTDAASGYNNVNLSSFNYRYLVIRGIAGATAQKGWYKLLMTSRND